MCMWQSQAFGGPFSFGGSVPDDQGTACCVCPVDAFDPAAMMIVAPIALRRPRRAMTPLMLVSSQRPGGGPPTDRIRVGQFRERFKGRRAPDPATGQARADGGNPSK